MDAEDDSLIIYSRGTKNICTCVVVAIFLILLFIISPLNQFIVVSFFGKGLILAILLFALYKNILVTNNFSKNIGGIFSEGWNDSKMNIFCSYGFSFFIIILFFSVLNRLFR